MKFETRCWQLLLRRLPKKSETCIWLIRTVAYQLMLKLLKTSWSFFLFPWRLSRSGCKRWVSRTRSLLLLLPQGRKAVGGSPRQGRARACHRRSSHYMSALIGGYRSKPLSGEIFPRFGSRAPASVYFLLSSLRPMQIWSAEEFVYKVDFLLGSVDLYILFPTKSGL